MKTKEVTTMSMIETDTTRTTTRRQSRPRVSAAMRRAAETSCIFSGPFRGTPLHLRVRVIEMNDQILAIHAEAEARAAEIRAEAEARAAEIKAERRRTMQEIARLPSNHEHMYPR
jgi:regulator of protease activity HflC (stomatin/prohibitin superfamily)